MVGLGSTEDLLDRVRSQPTIILSQATALDRLSLMGVVNQRNPESDLAGRVDPAQEFLALLEPIKPVIERYALRSAWDREQGQDIVQQAVMTAWREFHRFKRGTNFRAWVFRILMNTIFSFNKKTGRDRKHHSPLQIEGLDGVWVRESAWASVLEDPARVLESLDDRLAGAIGELRIEERQCLLLRLVEGLSYKQISSLLSMPLGSVMSHVYRARLKLREELADLAVELNLVKDTS